jgi:hypothetical protein
MQHTSIANATYKKKLLLQLPMVQERRVLTGRPLAL